MFEKLTLRGGVNLTFEKVSVNLIFKKLIYCQGLCSVNLTFEKLTVRGGMVSVNLTFRKLSVRGGMVSVNLTFRKLSVRGGMVSVNLTFRKLSVTLLCICSYYLYFLCFTFWSTPLFLQ